MENTVTIKPIFWRLLIWILVPATIGCILGNLLYYSTQNNSSSVVNWSVVAGFAIGAALSAILNRNRYSIVITQGQVSGMGTGFGGKTVTFPIPDLDKESLSKQSIFEKILAFHTLRSVNGQKIVFPHFIYGRAAVDRVREALENHLL